MLKTRNLASKTGDGHTLVVPNPGDTDVTKSINLLLSLGLWVYCVTYIWVYFMTYIHRSRESRVAYKQAVP